MSRSEIVFERYSLVKPEHPSIPKNVPRLAEDKTFAWNMNKQENRNSADSGDQIDP